MGIKVTAAKTGRTDELLFSYDCMKLKHQDESFGYRIEAEGKAVAYCLDTAYCNESIALAKNSDILIHECTNKPNFTDPGWGHSNPEEAAKIAKEANVGKLFLTHFMPDFYATLESRKEAEGIARKTFRDSSCTFDDMTVEI